MPLSVIRQKQHFPSQLPEFEILSVEDIDERVLSVGAKSILDGFAEGSPTPVDVRPSTARAKFVIFGQELLKDPLSLLLGRDHHHSFESHGRPVLDGN